jgi:hypothetical protein
MSFQVSTCQAPFSRWWMRARSPYFAAWRKKTPTVVRSLTVLGSILAALAVVVLTEDVALFDRLDR